MQIYPFPIKVTTMLSFWTDHGMAHRMHNAGNVFKLIYGRWKTRNLLTERGNESRTSKMSPLFRKVYTMPEGHGSRIPSALCMIMDHGAVTAPLRGSIW
jgi:hypothetical protein